MERYTLSLAVFDYLPVLAGGIAVYLICRYCAAIGQRSGTWIIGIPLLALTGGLLKATWKTVYVTTGFNVQWMSDQLFFFIASSYVLVTGLVYCSLSASADNQPLSTRWWKLPLTIASLIVAAALYLLLTNEARYWALLLLGVMAVTNLAFSVRLIMHAKALRNWAAVALFSTGLALSYVLVGLARIEQQTLELQWTEEVLNLFAQSMTALAAWLLYRVYKSKPMSD